MEKIPFTPNGLKKLKDELNQLKSFERQNVKEHSGSKRTRRLSENAEYHGLEKNNLLLKVE